MSNYYDLLKVATSASQVEILTAAFQIDNMLQKYIQQEVDPDKLGKWKAMQSNLNTIRTTLMDPVLREKYDQSIGLKSSVPQTPQPAINSQQTTQINQSSTHPANTSIPQGNKLWYCENCQTQNSEGSKHCQKCGNKLGRDCPHCGAIIPSTALFCAKCGADIAAFDREKAKQQLLQENHDRIAVLQEKIALETEEIEDWKDIAAGSIPPDIDIRSSSPCFRKYRRFEASIKPPNLTGLWLLISLIIGIIVGTVVRIPPDIALYVGLFFSLPVALCVLRFGGGCIGSLAVLCVAGAIGAAVVAWGGPILIGIFAGLISIPIVILSGKALQQNNCKRAIQEMATSELQQAETRRQNCKNELNRLTG